MIITQVIVFVSERIIQTIVYDEKGNQIPYLQGSNFENYKEILYLIDLDTEFTLGVFRMSGDKINYITYEKLAKAFHALNERKEIIKYFGNVEDEKEII